MNSILQGTCAQSGCQASQGGACIEGLPHSECPHFLTSATSNDTPAGSADSRILEAAQLVQLKGGVAFDLNSANDFILLKRSYLVALVSGPEAGKTTFAAGLYEAVRRNSLTRYGFAGSETLRAFEQRCHLSRTASGRSSQETERTQHVTQISFLHLKLGEKESGALSDILLSDRRGEDFNEVMDTPDKINDIEEVKKSDCIAILVDGERCVSAENLHPYLSKIRRLVQALGQNSLLGQKRVQVILTKYDTLSESSNLQSVRAKIAALCTQIESFTPAPLAVSSYEVAARPNTNALPVGYGIENVVNDWVPVASSFSPPRLSTPGEDFRARLLARFGAPK